MSLSPQLLQKLRTAATTLPPNVLRSFINILEQSALNPIAEKQFDEADLSKQIRSLPTAEARFLLLDLLTESKLAAAPPTARLTAIAAALEAMLYSEEQSRRSQQIELVWTGPAGKIPIRQTRQVLAQIIESSVSELLIVSYVVYQIPEIVELLKKAVERGVRLTLIFENPEESDGKILFQNLGEFEQQIFAEVRILTWSRDQRPLNEAGKSGALHVKCAVADRGLAFISSANLTLNAFSLNMELGVLIKNKVIANRISDHFESLIQLGVLIVHPI